MVNIHLRYQYQVVKETQIDKKWILTTSFKVPQISSQSLLVVMNLNTTNVIYTCKKHIKKQANNNNKKLDTSETLSNVNVPQHG